MPHVEPPPGYHGPSFPAVSRAPGPDGNAVLNLRYGATVTPLGVPAARVAAQPEDYVKFMPRDY